MKPTPKFSARRLCEAAAAQCPIPRPKTDRNAIDRAKRAWDRITDPKMLLSDPAPDFPRLAAEAVADALRITRRLDIIIPQWAALPVFSALDEPQYSIALERPPGVRIGVWALRRDGKLIPPYHASESAARAARRKHEAENTPIVRRGKIFSYYGDLSRPREARLFLKMHEKARNSTLARRLGFTGKGSVRAARNLFYYADRIVEADEALGNGDIDGAAEFQRHAANVFKNDIAEFVIFREHV